MPGLLGKKIGMTSVFSADGKNVPCTVIEAGPCVVTQVKTVETDGYEAVQLGFQEKKEKNTSNPLMGHFKKAGTTPKRHLAEFTFDEEHNLGDIITVELFNDVDFVDVIGTSKGKGFQGVVKRHHFGGVGQQTHGQHNRLRKPGSIGACSYPAKVFKKRCKARFWRSRAKIRSTSGTSECRGARRQANPSKEAPRTPPPSKRRKAPSLSPRTLRASNAKASPANTLPPARRQRKTIFS